MTRGEEKRLFVLNLALERRSRGAAPMHVRQLAKELNAHGFRVNGKPYNTTNLRGIYQVVRNTVLWVEKSGRPDSRAEVKTLQDAFEPRPWLQKKVN